jgi:hypothetical protein
MIPPPTVTPAKVRRQSEIFVRTVRGLRVLREEPINEQRVQPGPCAAVIGRERR